MENKIDPFIYFNLDEGEELKLIMQSNRCTPNIKENYYYISSYGRVFSTYRSNKTGKAIELHTEKTKDEYIQIPLFQDNRKSKTIKLSRLVLSYFGPNIENSKMEANHKDFNRANNNINNLEWLSHEDNLRYSKNRLFKKIDDDAIIDIFNRINNLGESPEDVAKIYNCAVSTIKNAAHGINEFAKKHKKLGLYYKKLNNGLTDNEVKEIYEALLKNEDISKLAEKYNVSIAKIKEIRSKGYGENSKFAEILKDYPDIHFNNMGLDVKTLIKIHFDAISEIYSTRELENKYNITAVTLYDIKFCRNAYKFLQTEYLLTPPEPNPDNKTPVETALKICEMAKTKSSKEISWETGMSITTVNNIKFCRDGFEYLKTEYGITPASKLLTKKNYLSEDTVFQIYWKSLDNKISINDLAKMFGVSYATVYNIKNCLGPYSYLKTEEYARQKRIKNTYPKRYR